MVQILDNLGRRTVMKNSDMNPASARHAVELEEIRVPAACFIKFNPYRPGYFHRRFEYRDISSCNFWVECDNEL
jgi:hypothetical protein